VRLQASPCSSNLVHRVGMAVIRGFFGVHVRLFTFAWSGRLPGPSRIVSGSSQLPFQLVGDFNGGVAFADGESVVSSTLTALQPSTPL